MPIKITWTLIFFSFKLYIFCLSSILKILKSEETAYVYNTGMNSFRLLVYLQEPYPPDDPPWPSQPKARLGLENNKKSDFSILLHCLAQTLVTHSVNQKMQFKQTNKLNKRTQKTNSAKLATHHIFIVLPAVQLVSRLKHFGG